MIVSAAPPRRPSRSAIGDAIQSLGDGLARSIRLWTALLPWLAISLLVSALSAYPVVAVASAGTMGPGWPWELAEPTWPRIVDGLFGGTVAAGLAGAPPAAVGYAVTAVLLGALGLLLQAVAYSLLAPYPIERYLGSETSLRDSVKFWAGAMLRLWLVSLAVQAVCVGAFVALGLAVSTDAAILVAGGLFVLGNAIFELARVAMILGHDTRVRRGLARAIRTLVRHPLACLTLWAALAITGGVLTGAVGLAVFAFQVDSPLLNGLLAEAAVMVAVWQKAWRLASQASLLRRLELA